MFSFRLCQLSCKQTFGSVKILTNVGFNRGTQLTKYFQRSSSYSLPKLSNKFSVGNIKCYSLSPGSFSSREDSHISREQVDVPLFERPATHVATLQELKLFIRDAKQTLEAIQDSWEKLDGGANQKELERELDWLLDDAIEGYKDSETSEWRTTSWMSLCDQLNDGGSHMNSQVKMRESLSSLSGLWNQRTQLRVPFQYLVGCSHWRDLVLLTRPGVLCPRPETEILIDLCQDALAKEAELGTGVWLDLGTGSGALAIALAQQLQSQGRVLAVEASPAAADVARLNVQRCGVAGKVSVVDSSPESWYGSVEVHMGNISGIVSNPPYIESEVIQNLQVEVKEHEPHMALDGGAGDGMQDLIEIVNGAYLALRKGGFIALETGGGSQPAKVKKMLEKDDRFSDIQIVSDFANIPRHVTGYRN